MLSSANSLSHAASGVSRSNMRSLSHCIRGAFMFASKPCQILSLNTLLPQAPPD